MDEPDPFLFLVETGSFHYFALPCMTKQDYDSDENVRPYRVRTTSLEIPEAIILYLS